MADFGGRIINQARTYLRSGGVISKSEAQNLIKLARKDKIVTADERGALATVLDDFRQTDAANRVLAKFLGLP